MSLEDLLPFFETHAVSPDDWPVFCNVTMPNEHARSAWPDWPAAALPEAGRAGAGKGRTFEEAVQSGLGEIVEVASMCRWADDNAVHAPREALPGEVWDRSVLLGFSARQNAERDRWNKNLLGLDWIPRNAPDPGPWLPARDLAGQRVWVSADAVLLDYSNRDTGVPRALADTNGAAAGATHRQAQSLALLELIERDATGRWWYGQRSRSGLDISRLSDVGKDLLQALESRGLTVRLFDITTDLCVPVVAAVCADKNASPVSVGFAAAPEFANAAMKALCEMAQMRLLLN